MNFTHAAVSANPTCAAETMMVVYYLIQRVGVARNFDAAIDFSGRGDRKIF
jgi:hypothetical protein